MRCRSIRHALAIVACVLIVSPASGAEHAADPAPTPAPAEASAAAGAAQALVDAGRFEEAIVALRPLLGREPVEANVLFLYGVASLEAAQRPGRSAGERNILLNEAIAAFRAMLVNAPQLVRVRLELARAFFFKGRDGLARRHFELVLAGGVPEPVAAKVHQFLNLMRARKRWSGYFGTALAPDSNLNAASDTEIIYIDVFGARLPFRREGDFGAQSGLGLSIWGGGEYQQPLRQRLRLRVGADAVQREYSGNEFDQYFLAAHAGPRWLAGPRTEVSLLGTAQRQWLGGHPYVDESGVRLEVDRRVGLRLWARGTAAARQRDHKLYDFLDGPLTDLTLDLAWAAAATLQVQMTVGYERDHAASVHWRSLSRRVRVGGSLALPLGFTLGGSAQMRRTYYEGNGCVHQVLDCRQRVDRTHTFSLSVLNRGFTLFRFSPQLAFIHEARATNAQALDYDRNVAELRFVRQF